MVKCGITLAKLLQLPFGVALPLHESIRACQSAPPTDWPAAAYELVQRQDIEHRVNPDTRRYATSTKVTLSFLSLEIQGGGGIAR